MFKQNSKYRLIYLTLALLVFGYSTVYSFYKFSIGDDKGMSMIGGIAYGIMAIFYAGDLYVYIKNRKQEKLNNADKGTGA